MSESKIQIKVGHVEFSGEGNQDWLASQLEKILDRVPDLLKIELANPQNPSDSSGLSRNSKGGQSKIGNLPLFLKEKNATTNQNKKFLATAVFLQVNGKNRMSTSDVTKCLKDANQSRLNNASLNLSQLISQGFAEKDGKDFYITSEGFRELGIDD